MPAHSITFYIVAGVLVYVSGYLTARSVEHRNRRRAIARSAHRARVEAEQIRRLVSTVIVQPAWHACPAADYVRGVRYPCTRPDRHTGAHHTEQTSQKADPHAA